MMDTESTSTKDQQKRKAKKRAWRAVLGFIFFSPSVCIFGAAQRAPPQRRLCFFSFGFVACCIKKHRMLESFRQSTICKSADSHFHRERQLSCVARPPRSDHSQSITSSRTRVLSTTSRFWPSAWAFCCLYCLPFSMPHTNT